MATYLGTGAVFEVRSGATAGNLGGGGFNPTNTHFIANWTATNANTASPVVASTSYSFVSSDVGTQFFVKSGTGWTPGYYPIVSVSGGAATLSAAVGAAVQATGGRYQTNTVAGCATTASPTAGNCGIDYSQQNAAQFTAGDLTGTTTTCTSATNPFGPQHAGNFLCFASGTGVTAGFYEIVSVSSVTATLDRTAGTSYSLVTYYLGGAVSLGGTTTGITDIIFFALGSNAATSGILFFVKNGTYTLGGSPTLIAGNSAWQTFLEGYNILRGDTPIGSNRPIINCTSAFNFSFSNYNAIENIIFTGSFTSTIAPAAYSVIENCSIFNTSTTASKIAISGSSMSCCFIINSEICSYNGTAISDNNGGTALKYCYIHDSNTGIISSANNSMSYYSNNIFCALETAIDFNSSQLAMIDSNTFIGYISLSSAILVQSAGAKIQAYNNIFWGNSSALLNLNIISPNFYSNYSCFFNNTINTSSWNDGPNSITTNPSFTNLTVLLNVGTVTTSGTTLTDTGQNFTTSGLVAYRDYISVISSTGGNTGTFGIIAVGTNTLTTDNSLGTGTAVSYQIITGRNFLPTGNV